LLIEERNGILTATFNRPKRKNAMNPELYIDFLQILRQAKSSESVRVLVLTGSGDYYSSGNDLSNFMTVDLGDTEAVQKVMKDSKRMLEELIEELISFPKILIALVNGPAIGVGCTHLALCDFVYTVNSAWFHTPFVSLAQVPECCSSYTFPKLLGSARANDVLMNGRKFSGKEAKDWGFATDSFPTLQAAQEAAYKAAETFIDSSENAILQSKALIRSEEEQNRLRKVAAIECEQLYLCWMHPDLITAVMKFMSRSKAKL
jgi:peroxisomal 3,2-trans-enoyl-CoA isomerase